jgi:hypothetical protein
VLKTLKVNIDEFADLNKLCLLDSETSIDVSRNFVKVLLCSSLKERNVCKEGEHLYLKT